MKCIVTGANGQLGQDLVKTLQERGHEVIGTFVGKGGVSSYQFRELDITSREQVHSLIEETLPDVVLHCAAWTAVDAAEDEENINDVFDVNANGTRYIAEACRTVDAKLLYISTDYVFDGQGDIPWAPDSKEFAPLNIYGKSKLDGEIAVSELLDKFFVVRIAWVFGLNGNNFIKTMLNIGKKYPEIKVVNDQIGTPTYTKDLSYLLASMIESEEYGFYHATNEGGYISWYDFAREIFSQAGYDTKLIPVSSEEYGLAKARRPHNSRLDKSKLTAKGFDLLPEWQDALARYLEELKGEL